MAGGARRTATVKPNNQRAPGPLGNATGLITPQTDPNPNGNSAPPIKPAPNEEGFWSNWGGAIHTALDVVGMIPVVGEVADGANALIYLAEGDAVNAALSAAAMLPVGGQAATGVKWGKKGVDTAQAVKAATKAEKELVEQAVKQGSRKEAGQEVGKAASSKATRSGEIGSAGGHDKKRAKSLREQYLGRTPGKDSRTGKEVQERMRKEGTLRDGPDGPEFKAKDGEWYQLKDADMSHNTDAVKWWNETGHQYGAKSKEVRDWMLDSRNYSLEHYGANRSAGAQLPDRYVPPRK